jgi:hypothetical protein
MMMADFEPADLEQRLRLTPGQKVAVMNAPANGTLVIPTLDGIEPDNADAVIGFVTRRSDMDVLGAVCAAARATRLSWIAYPKPGRLDTDLDRDWLTRAIRQHRAQSIGHASLDDTWSALLIEPPNDDPDVSAADSNLAWPTR